MLNLFARAFLTLVLGTLLVGFGVCGAYGAFGGLVLGLSGDGDARVFGLLMMGAGAIGLLIAWACWKGIAGRWRKRPSSGTQFHP